MWFLATCNQIWLSGYSIKPATKMFSETRREHSEDQWILGGQVSLHKHCFTMVRAMNVGQNPLLSNCPPSQRAERGCLRAWLQRGVPQVLCGFKRRGHFPTGYSYPASTWSAQSATPACASAFLFLTPRRPREDLQGALQFLEESSDISLFPKFLV